MPMSDHEVDTAKPSFYSEEDGKPTLWDTPGPDRIPVVVLRGCGGQLEITSEEEVVAAFLEDEEG